MKMLGVKLLLGAFILAELQYGTLGRRARSLLGFGGLILCKTRKNPVRFNGYGCYCGFGGQGQPVDGLDRCCEIHDNCYGSIEKRYPNRSPHATYITPYTINPFTCKCTSWQWTDFQRELCKCDEEAAACFKRNRFNQRYAYYDKSRC